MYRPAMSVLAVHDSGGGSSQAEPFHHAPAKHAAAACDCGCVAWCVEGRCYRYHKRILKDVDPPLHQLVFKVAVPELPTASISSCKELACSCNRAAVCILNSHSAYL